MNTIVKAILLFLLTGSTPIIAQSDVKEQLVVPLSDPGKPGTLTTKLVNSSIHVIGYNGKDVIVEAVSDAKSNNKREDKVDEFAKGMKRIDTRGDIDITAEERDNNIKLTQRVMGRIVHFTIKIPQRFNLRLTTVNNKITVENVNGELEINNVNGPIELTNISGSAVANTVNGNLTATFKGVDSNKPMAFSTLNGRVDVTFPNSAKANLKMKTDRGDIFSDFDIDIDKAQPKASRSSQSGMYRVTIEDWVYGKINGGGPEVMMKSMQGSIYVRKAK